MSNTKRIIKNGVYSLKHNDFTEYYYVQNKGILLVVVEPKKGDAYISFSKDVETSLRALIPFVKELKPISNNDFMGEYRKALGMTDELLGVRGVLIKPEKIYEKLYAEDDKIYIK